MIEFEPLVAANGYPFNLDEYDRVGMDLNSYKDDTVKGPFVWREHFYPIWRGRDPRGAEVFLQQAEDMGRYLSEIPDSILSQVSLPSLSCHQRGNTMAARWIWSLFDLAWQQPPESVRHEPRRMWATVDEGPVLPFEKGGTRSILWFQYEQSEVEEWTESYGPSRWGAPPPGELPVWYFSEIRDVAAYSVWAINQILAVAPTAESPAKKKPQKWRPTEQTKAIIRALKKGENVDQIVSWSGKSAENVRKIRSRAREHGLLPRKESRET